MDTTRSLERSKYLDDKQLAQLLEAARRQRGWASIRGRDYALLAMLANVGMRPSEALAMRVSDFQLSDHAPTLRVRRLKKRSGSGATDELPISRGLGRVLRKYLVRFGKNDGRAFPISLRNLELRFQALARAAGLPEGVRLYCLRHTAGTRAWRASHDLRLVQEQLGHASPITTQIYTHVDPEARRRIAELAGSAL